MGSDNPLTTDSDMSGIFDDPTFSNLQYESYGAAESPFDANRFFNLSSLDSADSPNFAAQTPPKAPFDNDPAATPQNRQGQALHNRSLFSSHSAESSSQDSSSESSGIRKRKTTSESPPRTEQMASVKAENQAFKMEDAMRDGNNYQSLNNFKQSMNNLSLDQDFMSGNPNMNGQFDFESAASSPGMDMNGLNRSSLISGPPAGTIEPAHFFLGSSNASPAASTNAPNTADGSPAAMFSTAAQTTSGSDMFSNGGQMWGATTANPAWPNDYANNFASPSALGLTPSPTVKDAAHFGQGAVPVAENRIPLHVAPIPAKSRVETQINIKLTMDRLPLGVKYLHLPTHTIAKAKLLAKDLVPSEDTLELHAMLVCTSSMANSRNRQRALQKATQQNNDIIQARGVAGGVKKEEDEVADDDKPGNGGEVRICQNCINRERKRAARKKLKKEEEQAHWEKYETERVIVFNTNEHKEWQGWKQSPPPKETSVHPGTTDFYPPSETAVQVNAPMRIACYCRHQNEKDGFQVIFTIKDYKGTVVAQQMSDSILITDDHKTHPLGAMGGPVWYDGGTFAQGAFGSQSMVDLHSHMPPMSMSKSTGNLQQMGFGPSQPFHSSSSVHQMPNYASQNTSGTLTPRNLSRPASPTGLDAGPSKKRKSSSAHRRVPSGLTMTRVNTSQPMASGPGPFSPTSAGQYQPGADASYISLPHGGQRAQFHTQPPTPSENAPFPYGALNRTPSLDQNGFQAFYSAPNSAHQSRAPSPVLQGPNLAAFQRQQAHGGAHAMPIRTNTFNSATPTSAPAPPPSAEPERPTPIINKVTPSEGPISGGIEVSIYGQGFAPGMDVMFGDRIATATTYWGEKALCCVLPPGQVGPVAVAIAPSHGRKYPTPAGPPHVFRYHAENAAQDVRMMEMALRFYSLKMTGDAGQWQNTAKNAANAFMSTGGGPGGPGSGPNINMPGTYPHG